LKSRILNAFAFSGVLVMGLVACTGGAGDTSSTGGGETTTGGVESASCMAEPVAGGVVTVGKQNEVLSLSPYSTPGGFGDTEALNMIYETIVRMDPTGATQDIVGGVADRWSVSDDGLTYTFNIRDGAAFSNGRQVTGEDIKHTLDNWSNPEVSQWAAFSRGYQTTRIIDDSTVEVVLTEPVGGFLYSLAMVTAAVVPKQEMEAAGDAFFEAPIGSGPFVVSEWIRGSSISFTPNEHYWSADGPFLDSVVFQFITDDNNRTLALQSGDVQMIDVVPWSQVQALQADEFDRRCLLRLTEKRLTKRSTSGWENRQTAFFRVCGTTPHPTSLPRLHLIWIEPRL
jgi:peptide/nickel transport system substrate-binding protein